MTEVEQSTPDKVEQLTPETYDPGYNGRYYCASCGYISVYDLDLNNTEFLDLHCKCGSPVVRAPDEEPSDLLELI